MGGLVCVHMATETKSSSDLHVLEERYGSSSLSRRFIVVGSTVRQKTEGRLGLTSLQKFLKVCVYLKQAKLIIVSQVQFSIHTDRKYNLYDCGTKSVGAFENLY